MEPKGWKIQCERFGFNLIAAAAATATAAAKSEQPRSWSPGAGGLEVLGSPSLSTRGGGAASPRHGPRPLGPGALLF